MPSEILQKQIASHISKQLAALEENILAGKRADIFVPKGQIRTVEKLLDEYKFISNHTIRRNICYAVEALDFYRWIINRFKLYGPVSSYLYKTGIVLADMIVEAMTRDFLKQRSIRLSDKHSKNIKKLKAQGVPLILCTKIKALHSRRSNIHLHLVTELESVKYTLQDWNRSIICLRHARESFKIILNPSL